LAEDVAAGAPAGALTGTVGAGTVGVSACLGAAGRPFGAVAPLLFEGGGVGVLGDVAAGFCGLALGFGAGAATFGPDAGPFGAVGARSRRPIAATSAHAFT
jgi:hypothetical protein